ncbi:hypothetical protein BLOT_000399 [Blomia tropicalis]|nr:hypothetical protein BLOT_000399 [Blomia tropicalis]
MGKWRWPINQIVLNPNDVDHEKRLETTIINNNGLCNQNSVRNLELDVTNAATKTFEFQNETLLSFWHEMKNIRAIGIICTLGSVIFWSCNGLFFKLNQSLFHIHALETLTISSLIVALIFLLIIFMFYDKPKYETNDDQNTNANFDNWPLLFGVPGERFSLSVRCILGTISLACFYSSYRYIPLSDATTIRFTSSIFIAIFAHFFVQEPFGLLQIINSCTTFAGVVLIGRPSFLFESSTTASSVETLSPQMNKSFIMVEPIFEPSNQSNQDDIEVLQPNSFFKLYSNSFWVPNSTQSSIIISSSPISTIEYDQFKNVLFGVLLSLVAAISISISMIYMRKLKKTPAPLVIFWFSITNVILGLFGLLFLGEYQFPTESYCWILILLITLCTGLDQLFITLALKLENAGAVAVIQALCVVLSFIFSILILQESIYWSSALGGLLIFFSVITLGLARMIQEFNQSSSSSKSKWKSKSIFQVHLVNYSPQWIHKSKSFDIIDKKQTINLYSNYFHQFQEPYLLRMTPICNDSLIDDIGSNLTISTDNSTDANNNNNNKY